MLREDGTLWLNMGDSYAGSWGNYHPTGKGGQRSKGTERYGRRAYESKDFLPPTANCPGLKPKDLCMMPARLALALQQPYYTGRIKKETDRVWLAAMIEAEGCMFIHKRKAGTPSYSTYTKKDGSVTSYDRLQDTYGAGLEVASTDRVIVERCMEIAGIGSICQQSPDANPRRKQTIYRWSVRSNECRWIIAELYPHFIAKRLEARLVIGCPSAGLDAQKAHESLKAIHQGGETAIDFPAPKSLFEPGWYLRSECIWAKKNCMPESVTDRPTKSHEMIYLLTKSARYFYDQEAVRETASAESIARISQPNFANQTGGPKDYRNGINPNRSIRQTLENFAANPGRNLRSVWTIATEAFSGSHFAVFPRKLAERCILAGTSERGCCAKCGKPWVRVMEKVKVKADWNAHGKDSHRGQKISEEQLTGNHRQEWNDMDFTYQGKTLGWRPTCSCYDNDYRMDFPESKSHRKRYQRAAWDGRWGRLRKKAVPSNWKSIPCTVLDPFGGSGTTAEVAIRHGRRAILIELKPEYVELARKRLAPALEMAKQGRISI